MTISDCVKSCERNKLGGNKNLLQKVTVESTASLRCKHFIVGVLFIEELTLPGAERLRRAAVHVEQTLLLGLLSYVSNILILTWLIMYFLIT